MNGVERTPISRSEMARLIRNFCKFLADLFPYSSTRMTTVLPVNARNVVNEYSVTRNVCPNESNASSRSNVSSEPVLVFRCTVVTLFELSHTGSAMFACLFNQSNVLIGNWIQRFACITILVSWITVVVVRINTVQINRSGFNWLLGNRSERANRLLG